MLHFKIPKFIVIGSLLFCFFLVVPAMSASTCDNAVIKIIPRNISNEIIPGIKYDMYKLVKDANGFITNGDRVAGGTIDKTGIGTVNLNIGTYVKDKNGYETFKKTAEDGYVLRMYDKNANVGEFWFYYGWKFYCGEKATIERQLSALITTIRDTQGKILRNQSYSIYRQETDVDGNPILVKKELVGNFSTGDSGDAKIYLAYDHPYNKNKKGTYVFTTKNKQGYEYVAYGIDLPYSGNAFLDYRFGSTLFQFRNGANEPLTNQKIQFYEQKKDQMGRKILGKQLSSGTTSDKGELSLDYPATTVAVVLKDGAGKDITYFDNKIPDRNQVTKRITTNLARLTAKLDANNSLPIGTSVKIKSLTTDSKGFFHPDKILAGGGLKNNYQADFILAPGTYLFSITNAGKEYGRAFKLANGKYYQISLTVDSKYLIDKTSKFSAGTYEYTKYAVGTPTSQTTTFRGQIVTLDDQKTQLWYIEPDSGQKYQLDNASTTIRIFERLGTRITVADLNKLPIAVTNTYKLADTDGDGLNNEMEAIFMTSSTLSDTDGDGYVDGKEVQNNYNPKGAGAKIIDQKITKNLAGKIVIVGQGSTSSLWYVNSKNSRLYYITRTNKIIDILKTLSSKITNKELDNIKAGTATY